ncbi:MAG: hypothetical protein ACREXR_10165 [Gammaproteobacteria bacterium]
MDEQPLSTALPTTAPDRPRTYLISGGLGVIFFTISGLLWNVNSFLGSLFLELGGGAVIVFLLEFILPSVLGYADNVSKVLRAADLVWSDGAVESLVTEYGDEWEVQQLFDSIGNGRYPARSNRWRGVTATGTQQEGCPVLRRTVSPGPTSLCYYVKSKNLRRKTVVIVSISKIS